MATTEKNIIQNTHVLTTQKNEIEFLQTSKEKILSEIESYKILLHSLSSSSLSGDCRNPEIDDIISMFEFHISWFENFIHNKFSQHVRELHIVIHDSTLDCKICETVPK